jgi:hypothetical protein
VEQPEAFSGEGFLDATATGTEPKANDANVREEEDFPCE